MLDDSKLLDVLTHLAQANQINLPRSPLLILHPTIIASLSSIPLGMFKAVNLLGVDMYSIYQ